MPGHTFHTYYFLLASSAFVFPGSLLQNFLLFPFSTFKPYSPFFSSLECSRRTASRGRRPLGGRNSPNGSSGSHLRRTPVSKQTDSFQGLHSVSHDVHFDEDHSTKKDPWFSACGHPSRAKEGRPPDGHHDPVGLLLFLSLPKGLTECFAPGQSCDTEMPRHLCWAISAFPPCSGATEDHTLRLIV